MTLKPEQRFSRYPTKNQVRDPLPAISFFNFAHSL